MNGIQLIKTRVNENNEVIVSARELYDFLEIKSNYSTWFERMSEYGFENNQDYILLSNLGSQNGSGGHNKTDHAIKLDMAKEIAMIQRSEKGKQARQYFLQIEKAWNSPEKIMERALEFAKQRVAEMETKLFEQQPKVFFAEAVGESDNTISVGELAKLIAQNGYPIGQNRLYEWMRENGYLIKREGIDYNTPTQKYIQQGLLRIKEGVSVTAKGSKTYKTTRVTGKGQQYFVNKLLGGR